MEYLPYLKYYVLFFIPAHCFLSKNVESNLYKVNTRYANLLVIQPTEIERKFTLACNSLKYMKIPFTKPT